MSRNSFLVFSCVLILTSGCQHDPKVTVSGPDDMGPALRHDTRIYIGTPPDGIYKKEAVADSGRRTAQELKIAFDKVSGMVFIGRNTESFMNSLDRARATHSQYLIYPTILAWEDHPTEWNAIPDKIDIKLEIVNVATGDTIYNTRIKARSRFMTDGGDHPDMLLPEPFAKFAESLQHAPSIPSALR